MAITGIPISEDQCIGDSLSIINSAFTTLDTRVTAAAAAAGTVTRVAGTAPISVATGTTTPLVSITAATTSAAGSMSSTDKAKLNDISAITGIVKCNGYGDFSAASSVTDYAVPTGNIATATKLQTARTINGASFDGSANITIPSTSFSGANVAKAWVNFNGITGAIRASFNVSSITRNGTPNTDGSGDITISFTNPMADTNYVVLCNGTSEGIDAGYGTYAIRAASMSSAPTLMSTSQVRIVMGGKLNGVSNYNMFTTTVAIFGN